VPEPVTATRAGDRSFKRPSCGGPGRAQPPIGRLGTAQAQSDVLARHRTRTATNNQASNDRETDGAPISVQDSQSRVLKGVTNDLHSH
jgi:hypothetical protein